MRVDHFIGGRQAVDRNPGSSRIEIRLREVENRGAVGDMADLNSIGFRRVDDILEASYLVNLLSFESCQHPN